MKRKLNIGLLFFLGVCLIVCATGAAILPKDKQYADYFLRMHAAELFRTQSFVLDKSWSYVSTVRLERVEMRFSCYKILTVNQARKLIVDLATELVDKINSDSKMKEKHLLKDPFTVDRLKIEVKTNNVFSRNSDVASVRVILLNNGQITYETYKPSTLYHGSDREYKETFEYALMLLDDPALIDQVDVEIRDNWKKKEWKGEMYPAERSLFTKTSASAPLVMNEPFAKGIPVPENQVVQVGETPFVTGVTTHQVSLDDAAGKAFFAHDAIVTESMFDKTFPTKKTALPNRVELSTGQVLSESFFDIAPATVVYGPMMTDERLKNSKPIGYGAQSLESADNMDRWSHDPLRKVMVESQAFPYTACALSRDWIDTSSWLAHKPGRKAMRYTEIVSSNALFLIQNRHNRELIAYETTWEEKPSSKDFRTKIVMTSDTNLDSLRPKHHPRNSLCCEEEATQTAFFEAPSNQIALVKSGSFPESDSSSDMKESPSRFQNWIQSFIEKGTYSVEKKEEEVKETSEIEVTEDSSEIAVSDVEVPKDQIVEKCEESGSTCGDGQGEVSLPIPEAVPSDSIVSPSSELVSVKDAVSPDVEPSSEASCFTSRVLDRIRSIKDRGSYFAECKSAESKETEDTSEITVVDVEEPQEQIVENCEESVPACVDSQGEVSLPTPEVVPSDSLAVPSDTLVSMKDVVSPDVEPSETSRFTSSVFDRIHSVLERGSYSAGQKAVESKETPDVSEIAVADVVEPQDQGAEDCELSIDKATDGTSLSDSEPSPGK